MGTPHCGARGDGGGDGMRMPQSVQSCPRGQKE